MEIKTITIRLPENEKDQIEAYCKKTGRNQTDLIREFIRGLPV